jgi:uncharacterized protein (TIGR03083 family)
MPEAMVALADESRALSAVLRELAPEELTKATNCPPWNLQELVVHIGDSIRVTDAPFTPAEPGDQPISAADYYRRPQRDTPAYRQRNVDRTQTLARTVPATVSAAQWFDDVSRHTLATLDRHDLDQAVVIPGRGAMRLTDWVTTRLISVAVHGLDVAITLGRTPWTTPSALQVSHPVLVDLLGGPPPERLRWDERNILIAGTGRRPLTEQEREVLGRSAERFPLLS